ncbi:MAG: cyclic nucleotide-binding domain-containing protein [Candidatus Dormibacteria bacterium]
MLATYRPRAAQPLGLSREAHEALQSAPLTTGLSPAALDHLADELQEQSFLPGHRVVTEGFSGQEFFIIVEGVAAVSVDAWRVARLGPGDFFGEIALLDEGLRFATITAETPLRCLVLANDELERVLVDHPVLAVNLLRAMVRRFRDTIAKGRALEVGTPDDALVALG